MADNLEATTAVVEVVGNRSSVFGGARWAVDEQKFTTILRLVVQITGVIWPLVLLRE